MDKPFGPNILPAFSAVMRSIGPRVEYEELVWIRQKCLAGFAKDNKVPLVCYALVMMKRLEEGDSVAYLMGMRMKRFIQLAREEAGRYEL